MQISTSIATAISTLALALATPTLVAACGERAPGGPAAPDVVPTSQTLFTHQHAVAYLPAGKVEYRAAIVFLPGLRDPATGNPLDSRRLVSGASGRGCSIWCSPSELDEGRRPPFRDSS